MIQAYVWQSSTYLYQGSSDLTRCAFWLGRCMWFLSWNSWHLSSTGCSSSSVVEEPSSASLCACCLPPLAGMRRMAERRLKNGSGISKILLNRWNVCQREHTHSNESWGSNAACVIEYVYVRRTFYYVPFVYFPLHEFLYYSSSWYRKMKGPWQNWCQNKKVGTM